MGKLTNYLRIKIKEYGSDVALKLSQSHLTHWFIDILGLKDSHTMNNPVTKLIGKCLDTPPASGEFNYWSAIGVAMYLTNNMHLDCSMAVHQCAHFCASPHLPHEKAMKCIGWYLKGLQTKGLIIQSTTSLNLDCYVDTDFAGIWVYEDKQDPS